jgi:hypothetical protein
MVAQRFSILTKEEENKKVWHKGHVDLNAWMTVRVSENEKDSQKIDWRFELNSFD